MSHPQPDGYLALPPSVEGDGVLVLHAWWGLNEAIRSVCTRLSQSGFVAFAPDLYHGKVAKTIPEAEALAGEIDANHVQAEAEVAAAAALLSERVGRSERGLAVVAFSLGCYYALRLADGDPERVRSVVLFYGTDGGAGGDFRNAKAAYLGHFAEHDPYETHANVDRLEGTLKGRGHPVTFYHYSGTGHWFFEPDRTDAFNQAAADLAWERTLAFLKRPVKA